MKEFLRAVVLAAFSAACAEAEIRAVITYDRGASAEMVDPVALGNAVILPEGALPFSRITRMEFDFGPERSLESFETQFKKGALDELRRALDPVLVKAAPFAVLPGNLEEFLILQMKVQYWTGQGPAMEKTVEILNRRNSPDADRGALYSVLTLLDQGRTADAAEAFNAMGRPDDASAPMALFIRGRLAMGERNYREALQHLARIVALHSRDPEWMPAATLYEGRCYKRTGYLDAAGNVMKELTERYPGGYWARRAEELK